MNRLSAGLPGLEKPRITLFSYVSRQAMADLETIRLKGRQEFLLFPPANFSRILHDYSEPKKGFFQWKGALEERLA